MPPRRRRSRRSAPKEPSLGSGFYDCWPEIAGDEHLAGIAWRVAAGKGKLAAMAAPDPDIESRKASVRAKVEHPFLIVKRGYGFTKTRYRGMAKNRNHLHMLFASANWLMRAAPSPSPGDGQARGCPKPHTRAGRDRDPQNTSTPPQTPIRDPQRRCHRHRRRPRTDTGDDLRFPKSERPTESELGSTAGRTPRELTRSSRPT